MNRGSNISGPGWTPERDEQLRTLWSQGLSSSAIAKRLGGFEHCQNNGRNAVIGRVKRHRDKAKTPDEIAFWTRSKRSSGSSKNKDVQSRRRRRQQHKEVSAKGEAVVLTHKEKLAIIDAVPDFVITVTDDEVQEAFRQRMLKGSFELDERPPSWSSDAKPRSSSRERFTCTEVLPGMIPCGKQAIHRTARCEEHGGRGIATIKLTGQEKVALRKLEPAQ